MFLPELLHGEEREIFGDQAYWKEADRQAALARGIRYRVNRRGTKQRPLTEHKRYTNRCRSARFVIAVWPRTRRGSTPRLRWRTCTCSDAGCCHGSGVSCERDDGSEEPENGLRWHPTARSPHKFLMFEAKFTNPDLYTAAFAEVLWFLYMISVDSL